MNTPLGPNFDAEALDIVEQCLSTADEEQRARVVADRCAGQPALRDKVERMLAMDQTRFRLLPTEALAMPGAPEEALPERVGPFRVTGLIGRGGMGTVVKAERDDGVYSQTVAIKLIRADLGDARARERFALERRILARLVHPSIARILDGGALDGRPYLVMDHVEGCPVTIDLARRRAGLDETLQAFLAICAAVSHAHRQLVVHADIKPSNVIATDDGIKLLDFGIARLAVDLDQNEVEGPYPLTRTYAAPERVAGGAPTIAGDVYSLAVLLHEMLTGRLPGETARPVSMVARETRSRIAPRLLIGDLDAIVARGIEPDPAQRYPDVGVLADEIGRHLARKPVEARGRDPRYRTARFLLRNRLPLAIGGAVFLALAAATAISLTLFFEARHARGVAETRFEEVRSLAKFQLFTLYDRLAGIPGTIAAREQLSERAQTYLNRLAALPGSSRDVRLETARGYDRLAGIQGVPTFANLGRIDAARTNLARARAMLAAMRSQVPADRAVLRELGRNRLMLADLLVWQDNDMAAARAALSAAEPLVTAGRGGDPEWLWLDAYRRNVTMDVLGWDERFAAEKALADATMMWLAQFPEREQRTTAFTLMLAETYAGQVEAEFYLGRPLVSLGRAVAADRMLDTALVRSPNDGNLLVAKLNSGYNLITSLEALRRRSGLLARSLELSEVARRLRMLEPNDELIGRRARSAEALAAQYLAMAGRREEALHVQSGIVAETWRRHLASPGNARIGREYASNAKVLGEIHWEGGLRPQACGIWRSATAMLEALDRRGHLNEWDRTNILVGLRHDLAICDGREPASRYRGGNI